MEILKNFGFDPVMLAAQVVNFLIILYILKRFLYKPVIGMLKKREDIISEGIKQAEESRITLEKTLEEEKKILNKASEEARKIIEDAKLNALEISKEIEDKTKEQVGRMISDAKLQIEQESKETERKLIANITLLASSMLTKSLEGVIGAKEQKQFVQKAIKEIKNTN